MVGIIKERYTKRDLAIAFDRTEPSITYWYYNGHIERHFDENRKCYFKRKDVRQLLLDIHAGKHNPCAIDVKRAARKLGIPIMFPETKRFRWKEWYDGNVPLYRVPQVSSIKIPNNDHLKCKDRQSYINTIAKLKPTGYVNR